MKNQQNAPNSTGVILLRYLHLHFSTGIPAIFRETFLLQEYSVIKCVKLLYSNEIHIIIGQNFL
jgi:hypothetical protein